MAIQNRKYMGENNQGSKARGWSVVAKIVAFTVGVFALQLLTRRPGEADSLAFQWLAAERDLVLSSGQVWRLLTYAFCHSEQTLLHIALNMLALYFLGRVVAYKLGEREFLWMYLTAALFAGMLQVCSMALSRNIGQDWALGASGAVSAVFVIYALHYPKFKLYLFGVLPIQAGVLLGLVVAYDVSGFLGLTPAFLVPEGTQVGHAAHLGGMVFGFLYFRWDMRITRWWDAIAKQALQVELPKSDLRVFNPIDQPEVDYSDRIDDILAKIHREGEGSLTDRERRVLSQASEHIKSSR